MLNSNKAEMKIVSPQVNVKHYIKTHEDGRREVVTVEDYSTNGYKLVHYPNYKTKIELLDDSFKEIDLPRS